MKGERCGRVLVALALATLKLEAEQRFVRHKLVGHDVVPLAFTDGFPQEVICGFVLVVSCSRVGHSIGCSLEWPHRP